MNYVLLVHRISEEPLTSAESKVACLALEGINREAIAHRLGLVTHTVRCHLNSIYQKCQVSNRAELIAKALKVAMQCQGVMA